jgi:hypothetical protein
MCLVLRIGDLSVRDRSGQLVATPGQGVVHPDQMTKQLALLVQVSRQRAEHHSACDRRKSTTHSAARTRGGVRQDPVLMEVPE